MIDAIIAGKVYGEPQSKTSKTGTQYVRLRVRVPQADGQAQFVAAVCFSETLCGQLLMLNDGDAVALAGSLTAKAWVNQAGEPGVNLDVNITGLLTAYHTARKKAAMQQGKPEGKPASPVKQKHVGPALAFADIPEDPV